MDGYIMELRKLVGHRPLIQCAASVIALDGSRVLLGKRSDNGCWGYSGGSVEIDEKVEDCAKRELFEEMGIEAQELEFFMINSGPEAHYIYPNGDEVSNVEIVYLCRKFTGTPTARDGEMTELRFFEADALPENISPPIRAVTDALVKKLKKE